MSVFVLLAKPPAEYAWAWGLERRATDPLHVHVIPALTLEARELPREDELVLWFGSPGVDPTSLLGSLARMSECAPAASAWNTTVGVFAAAHAAVRVLLGGMTARAPIALQFAVGANGKPRLDRDSGPAVQFSISHSRALRRSSGSALRGRHRSRAAPGYT